MKIFSVGSTEDKYLLNAQEILHKNRKISWLQLLQTHYVD